jgi:hypothetical protein
MRVFSSGDTVRNRPKMRNSLSVKTIFPCRCAMSAERKEKNRYGCIEFAKDVQFALSANSGQYKLYENPIANPAPKTISTTRSNPTCRMAVKRLVRSDFRNFMQKPPGIPSFSRCHQRHGDQSARHSRSSECDLQIPQAANA